MGFIQGILNFFGIGGKKAEASSPTAAPVRSTTPTPAEVAAVQETRRMEASSMLITSKPKVLSIDKFEEAQVEQDIHNGVVYLFGDNLVGQAGRYEEAGAGGQAAVMRPLQIKYRNKESHLEKFIIGIPTLEAPGIHFTDSGRIPNEAAIKGFKEAFRRLHDLQSNNEVKAVALPKGGFGTGIAKLQVTAPATFAALNDMLKQEFGYVMKETDGACWQLVKINQSQTNNELALTA